MNRYVYLFLPILIVALSSCSNAYYGAMEKAGIHKRDILVNRVEKARDSQQNAQQQFQSALEQFSSVVKLKDTDLKLSYERLNAEYKACEKVADKVMGRIDKVEAVSEDLFDEWEHELTLYQNKEMQRSSRRQLAATKTKYNTMLKTMKNAEKSMGPVLKIFRDNVLYLKHNLNAQAIGALKGEFSTLEDEISILVKRMNSAIASSNKFIQEMK